MALVTAAAEEDGSGLRWGGGGGGECEVAFWTPPLGLYKHPTAAEGSFPPNFSF